MYSENNVRTIYQRLLPILANKLVLELSDIKHCSEFVNDLGIYYLDTIQLIIEFEKEFQIMIDENNPKLKEIINVWDGAKYLNSILTTNNII